MYSVLLHTPVGVDDGGVTIHMASSNHMQPRGCWVVGLSHLHLDKSSGRLHLGNMVYATHVGLGRVGTGSGGTLVLVGLMLVSQFTLVVGLGGWLFCWFGGNFSVDSGSV